MLLAPSLSARDRTTTDDAEAHARIVARTARAWGRFRQAAVSSFAFVEAAGPLTGSSCCRRAWPVQEPAATAAPHLSAPMDPAEKGAMAAGVLRAMGLVGGQAAGRPAGRAWCVGDEQSP